MKGGHLKVTVKHTTEPPLRLSGRPIGLMTLRTTHSLQQSNPNYDLDHLINGSMFTAASGTLDVSSRPWRAAS